LVEFGPVGSYGTARHGPGHGRIIPVVCIDLRWHPTPLPEYKFVLKRGFAHVWALAVHKSTNLQVFTLCTEFVLIIFFQEI
jgi:hypothetical protein